MGSGSRFKSWRNVLCRRQEPAAAHQSRGTTSWTAYRGARLRTCSEALMQTCCALNTQGPCMAVMEGAMRAIVSLSKGGKHRCLERWKYPQMSPGVQNQCWWGIRALLIMETSQAMISEEQEVIQFSVLQVRSLRSAEHKGIRTYTQKRFKIFF